MLGLNLSHNFSGLSAEQCAAWGARIVRAPMLATADPVPAIKALKAVGILPLPVLVNESFFANGMQIQTVQEWGAILRPHVTHLQALNEADGTPTGEGASWIQDMGEVNRWLEEIRAEFPRPIYTLIGPGLVSGQPGWAAGLRRDLLDALAVHPYAKQPGSAELDGMLAEYAWYGLPLYCTEYDSRTHGMGTYLRDHWAVEAALVFCGHKYLDYGLVDHESARLDFIAATGTAPPVPPPEEPTVPEIGWIGDGILKSLEKKGYTAVSGEGSFPMVHAVNENGSPRVGIYNPNTDTVTWLSGSAA